MHRAELDSIYRLPFFDLLKRARGIHEAHWAGKDDEVQLCTLLSIKTGGCSEDCGYCAQSARYSTGVKAERLMELPEVMALRPCGAREWLDPLLHGRGVARGARGGPQI